ncbi:MAG: cytidylate kinase-like family protein [Treponema sp.]|nr:cytidylate kinase-like family protein [Treponema sp.]
MRKIITISREYGSGGRIIGKQIAENLGFEFYDKNIIDLAAKESGLSPDFIERTEQNISSTWLYNLLLGTNYAGVAGGTGQHLGAATLPLADQVFNVERKIILSIAKSPCVIVGRCADYILRTSDEIDRRELFNVFIYADMDAKVKAVMERHNCSEKEAQKIVHTIDKRRANHYSTFTEDTWGDRKIYDILVNSTTLGIEETAQMLTDYIKKA